LKTRETEGRLGVLVLATEGVRNLVVYVSVNGRTVWVVEVEVEVEVRVLKVVDFFLFFFLCFGWKCSKGGINLDLTGASTGARGEEVIFFIV